MTVGQSFFDPSVVLEAAVRPLVIEMVLLGGKSRMVAQFRELADCAGLEVVATGRQPSGYSVVECRPT